MHANPEIYISHTHVSTASVLGPYKILAQNYKSFMYWVYSSAVERLTADQQVPGSNPGAPFLRLKEQRLPGTDLRMQA